MSDGCAVEGTILGTTVGRALGPCVGINDSCVVVGTTLGVALGL